MVPRYITEVDPETEEEISKTEILPKQPEWLHVADGMADKPFYQVGEMCVWA